MCKEVIYVTKLAFKSQRLNKQTCDQLTGRVCPPPAGASDGLQIGATWLWGGLRKAVLSVLFIKWIYNVISPASEIHREACEDWEPSLIHMKQVGNVPGKHVGKRQLQRAPSTLRRYHRSSRQGLDRALLYAGIGFVTIRGCLQVLSSCREWMFTTVRQVAETLEVRVHCSSDPQSKSQKESCSREHPRKDPAFCL